jgi:hypothetical protein
VKKDPAGAGLSTIPGGNGEKRLIEVSITCNYQTQCPAGNRVKLAISDDIVYNIIRYIRRVKHG